MAGQDPSDDPVIDVVFLAQGNHRRLDGVRRFIGIGVRPRQSVLQSGNTFHPIALAPLVDGADAVAHGGGDVLRMFSPFQA